MEANKRRTDPEKLEIITTLINEMFDDRTNLRKSLYKIQAQLAASRSMCAEELHDRLTDSIENLIKKV